LGEIAFCLAKKAESLARDLYDALGIHGWWWRCCRNRRGWRLYGNRWNRIGSLDGWRWCGRLSDRRSRVGL
jgi:hypothetical protein